MRRCAALSITAALLVACAAGDDRGGTSSEGGGGRFEDQERDGTIHGSGQGLAGSSTPPVGDCPVTSGACRLEDGGFRCGFEPNDFCSGYQFECICPNGYDCTGSFCEPRACVGVWEPDAPDCDLCASEACCDEIEACLAAPDDCFDDAGEIDPFTTLGSAARWCVNLSCSDACSSICGRPFTAGTFDLDACIGASCCAELDTCDLGDEDWEGCQDCLWAGGGERCDDYIACAVESCGTCGSGCSTYCGVHRTTGNWRTDACVTERCCDELDACMEADEDECERCLGDGFGEVCRETRECIVDCYAEDICGSGISMGAEQNACLGSNCCLQFHDCSASGTEVEACEACIAAGGGERCDGALACAAGCTGG